MGCKHGLGKQCAFCQSKKKVKPKKKVIYDLSNEIDEKVKKLTLLMKMPVIYIKNIFTIPNYTLVKAVENCEKKYQYNRPNDLNLEIVNKFIEKWKRCPDEKILIQFLNDIMVKRRRKKKLYKDVMINSHNTNPLTLYEHIQSIIYSEKLKNANDELKKHHEDLVKFINTKWNEIKSPVKSFGMAEGEKYNIEVAIPFLNRIGIEKLEMQRSVGVPPPAIIVNFVMMFDGSYRCLLDDKGYLHMSEELEAIFPLDYIILLNLAVVIYYADLVIPRSRKISSTINSRDYKKDNLFLSDSRKTEINIKKIARIKPGNTIATLSNYEKNLEEYKRSLACVDPFRRRLPSGQKPSFQKIIEADQYGISLQGPDYPKVQYTFVKEHFRGSGDKLPHYYYSDYQAIKTFESVLDLFGY